MVSVVRNLATACVGPLLQFLVRLLSRCWPGLGSYRKTFLGKDMFPISYGFWQAQFLWAVGLRASLASWLESAFSSLPCGPLQYGFLLHQNQHEKSTGRWKPNQWSDISPPLTYYIRQTQFTTPAYNQGREDTRVWIPGNGWGTSMASENLVPHWLSNNLIELWPDAVFVSNISIMKWKCVGQNLTFISVHNQYLVHSI